MQKYLDSWMTNYREYQIIFKNDNFILSWNFQFYTCNFCWLIAGQAICVLILIAVLDSSLSGPSRTDEIGKEWLQRGISLFFEGSTVDLRSCRVVSFHSLKLFIWVLKHKNLNFIQIGIPTLSEFFMYFIWIYFKFIIQRFSAIRLNLNWSVFHYINLYRNSYKTTIKNRKYL